MQAAKTRVALATAGAVAMGLSMSTASWAQTSATSDSEAQKSGPQLEEIIVTADRRNSFSADLVQAGSFRGARQLDTPLTVSVITDQVLQSQQAQGLLDALRNSAGVTSSQTAPSVYSNLAIRGINVENRGNYRLNGSLPIVNLIDLPLEDKDRVEALKGASALYYGFTAPSGIINLTMKRPTDEPLLTVRAFGNDHGALAGHIDAGGTYGKWGARVNLVGGTVDSGIDHARGRRELEAGAFDFRPTDDITISLDVEHILKSVNEPGVYRFINTIPAPTVDNLYPTVPLPPLLDPETNFGPRWGNNRAEETNVLGAINWSISPAWALSVSGGTSRLRRDRHMMTLEPTDYATGEGVVRVGAQIGAIFRNTNIRGELAGTFDTWFLTHQVLVGASQNARDAFNPSTVLFTCPGATPTAPRVSCTQNIYNPRDIPQTQDPLPAGPRTRVEDTGYYVFDRITVASWLDLLGGVRKSDYRELSLDTNIETFADKPTSISYGAVVKPREWFSLYATYIEGLESTPGAPSTASNVGVQLPATNSEQKEAGIKVEPMMGLLMQAAYFEIDRGVAYVNGSNLYVQDGRAEFKGTEISVTGEITPDFALYASAMFLDAKQTEGAPTIVRQNANGSVTVSPTAVGKRIENTPETTFSLAAEYRLGRWVPGLSVSAGGYYVGDRATNQFNQAFAPSYKLFDLGAAYEGAFFDQEMTFRVNCENIANEKYFVSTGGFLLAQGGPRTIKFSIGTRF